MRIALLPIIVFCFLSCQHSSQHTSSQHTIDVSSVIHEGLGVDSITLGKVDRNSLKHYFSLPYDSALYGSYSIAISYPRFGAFFYYLQNDDSARIFSMSFDTAFKGLTGRGFDLRRMLVRDMMQIYGEPKWQMLESEHMLYAHYDSLGIYFAINPRNEPEPEFYADVKEDDEAGDSLADNRQKHYYDTAYARSHIAEITIGLPGTSY